MSDIEVSTPNWSDIPEQCPNCGGDFPDTIDSPVVDNIDEYRDGESDDGEYREAYCSTCGTILDRHYPNNPGANKKDPFCSPDPWVYRAQYLEFNTSLKRRESQVRALKEDSKSHNEIAEILGISKSTVSEYSRRIDQRVEEATETLVEIDNGGRLGDALERSFEGKTLVVPKWFCQSCEVKLSAGDQAVVVFENTTRQWTPTDIFCVECNQEEYQTSVHGAITSMEDFMDDTRELGSEFAIVKGDLRESTDSVERGKGWGKDSLKLGDPQLTSLLR